MNKDIYNVHFSKNQVGLNNVSLLKHALYERIISEGNRRASNHINCQYMNLVKEICCKCDTEWRLVKQNEIVFYNVLSSQDNYLAKLKILWNFALLLSNHIEGDDIVSSLNKANRTLQKMFIDSEFFIDTEKQKSNIYNSVFEITKIAIQGSLISNEFENEHTEAGRCKYTLFGIIIYLICETIFCRTVIPKGSVEFLMDELDCFLFDKNKHFEKKDFAGFERLPEMVDEIYKERVGFSDLIYYRYRKSVSEKEIHISDKYINLLNNKYIYNPNFYPQRMEEAELSVAAFISGYTDGFDPYILEPLEMKLNGFDDYLRLI